MENNQNDIKWRPSSFSVIHNHAITSHWMLVLSVGIRKECDWMKWISSEWEKDKGSTCNSDITQDRKTCTIRLNIFHWIFDLWIWETLLVEWSVSKTTNFDSTEEWFRDPPDQKLKHPWVPALNILFQIEWNYSVKFTECLDRTRCGKTALVTALILPPFSQTCWWSQTRSDKRLVVRLAYTVPQEQMNGYTHSATLLSYPYRNQ